MKLLGTYGGTVTDNKDPLKLGRVKVRVPHVYGPSDSIGTSVTNDNLPWALPVGLPAGGKDSSGGISWIPVVGDQVFVRFLDGDPEKPIFEWGHQSIPQSKSLELHNYDNKNNPVRAALTRYGHTIELNSGSIILTTKNGYTISLIDGKSNGEILVSTPAGNFVELDDSSGSMNVNVVSDCQVNVGGQIFVQANNADVRLSKEIIISSGDSVGIKATDLSVVTTDSITASTEGFLLMAGGALVVVQDGFFSVINKDGSGIGTTDTGFTAYSSGGSFVAVEDEKISLGTAVSNLVLSDFVTITSPGVMINSPRIALGPSAAFTVALAEKIVLLFNEHTHGDGGPPPTVPWLPIEIGSLTTLSQ